MAACAPRSHVDVAAAQDFIDRDVKELYIAGRPGCVRMQQENAVCIESQLETKKEDSAFREGLCVSNARVALAYSAKDP
eukprot:1161736-Pelagomonas_calceolata.AAC.3